MLRFVTQQNRAILFAIAFALGFALTLAAIYFFEAAVADREFSEYGQRMLNRGMQIEDEAQRTLRAVQAIDVESCTEDYISRLRELHISATYIVNLGYVTAEGVGCDVIFGKNTPPSPLPRPEHIFRNGTSFWSNLSRNEGKPGVRGMSNDGAIVFIRQSEMTDIYSDYPLMTSRLETYDGSFIFTSSPRPDGQKPPDANDPATASRLLSKRMCDPAKRLCTFVTGPALAEWTMSYSIVTIAVFGGLAFGAASLPIALFGASRPLLRQLRRAVKKGQISAVYQPLVRMQNGQVVGVEALARWKDEDGNAVSPEVFIELAERNGFIGEITKIIISRTLRDLLTRLRGEEAFYVSINISVQDLESSSLLEFLEAETARYNIDPSRIALELTERSTAELANIESSVNALRQAGYRVFLDDFGTGYSSLAYLSQLPVDAIKVDRLFTQAVATQSTGTVLLNEICRIAQHMGLVLIFEGVETEEQAKMLGRISPSAIGQGWHYGRPVAAQQLP